MFEKYLRIIPILWLAFFVISCICFRGWRSSDIITPKSLCSWTWYRLCPFKVYTCIYDKDSRNFKTTHFKALNFNNQVFDHVDNTFKSCWSSSQSSYSTLSLYNLVSSAKSVAMDSAEAGKSLTKIRNKMGPKMEPWGTPLIIGFHSECDRFLELLAGVSPSKIFQSRILCDCLCHNATVCKEGVDVQQYQASFKNLNI